MASQLLKGRNVLALKSLLPKQIIPSFSGAAFDGSKTKRPTPSVAYGSRSLTTTKMTYKSTAVPPAAVTSVASRDERRGFMACFPDLVRNLTEVGFHKDLEEANKWFAKVLQYNVQGGKMNRGLAVPLTYKMLVPAEKQTEELMHQAYIVGWCVELMQAFFLVLDDIMDNSETRRGKECWYRKDGLGLPAINDAILMEAGIYKLLKLHCSSEPYYPNLIDLFHSTTMKTTLGQSLDLLGAQSGKLDLQKYTMERYSAIVKYKTAHYSFHLPIALAMHMAGISDPESHRQAKHILLEMGNLFQVQDDFLDCFGDPAVTGKVGTDIQDGKCSWLVVVALQRASGRQKQIIQDNYGSSDPEKVEQIKQLYTDLNLISVYKKYELNNYELICRLIEQTSRGVPHKVFYKMLEKIYQRES
ncbi:farnesyl pyrophosphate synthase-like isoform X3 [Amphibalanus amphitrite]|uniref:farnesyl pyrophosphate synthase-like isoform X3 n=1 Tax=Amphibalanus amphitrite TaxID=1232801 RepID=UPI001C918164|nr:farnesyl pyrophosphate synthase-like isoform X3 [Amphibalanus amphitrite]